MGDFKRLKRVGRFIVHEPRRVIRFERQPRPDKLTTYVDSDFAGCQRTRKSTAGGCIMMGSHCLKSWAKTLPILALSTGEAELMAVVRGTTEALGMRSLLKDLGMEVKLALRSDATAAIGIVARVGLGKVRHLAVADLWVQQAARRGEVECGKIPGQLNPGDMFTKPVDRATMERHMECIGQVGLEGRARTAPQRRKATQQEPQS